jgi:hypothetical protein
MGKLGWLTIALIAAGGTAAHAQGVRPRPKSANSAVHSKADADQAWLRHRAKLGRITGTITIDPAVRKSVLGSCHDVVVQVLTGEWKSVGAVQAFGNIRDGECAYAIILPARLGVRLRGFYGGPSGGHPGDFLELSPQKDTELAVQVGATTRAAMKLSYAYVR